MTPLQAYDFEGVSVRSFERDGVFWFAATDICRALDLSSPSEMVRPLDDEEKMTLKASEGAILRNSEGHSGHRGGPQSFVVVSEGGVYTVALRCREALRPGARAYRFRKWITGEVLPGLRRTGRYELCREMPSLLLAPIAAKRGLVRA